VTLFFNHKNVNESDLVTMINMQRKHCLREHRDITDVYQNKISTGRGRYWYKNKDKKLRDIIVRKVTWQNSLIFILTLHTVQVNCWKQTKTKKRDLGNEMFLMHTCT